MHAPHVSEPNKLGSTVQSLLYIQLIPPPPTHHLVFLVTPFAAQELLVDPLPEGTSCNSILYPNGACIMDLKEVCDLLYKMQRPAIAPNVRFPFLLFSSLFVPVSLATLTTYKLVYPHDWKEKDLILFNNRGVLHTVVGALKQDQLRMFHQRNLAMSDEPIGPMLEDVRRYA